MPIFDYKCPRCQNIDTDVLVKHSDDQVNCSMCHKLTDKMISPIRTFTCKGEGFNSPEMNVSRSS